jgi:hypothetical protein
MFYNVAIYQKYFLLIVPFGARTLVTGRDIKEGPCQVDSAELA